MTELKNQTGFGPVEVFHRLQTKHFSAIIFGWPGQPETGNVLEILPLRRSRELNHRCFGNTMWMGGTSEEARQIEASLVLCNLELAVRNGKTAKKALMNFVKMTPEKEREAERGFNWLMSL